MEVNELGQLNVEISNVVASEVELAALKDALALEFHNIEGLAVRFDRDSKIGRHHTASFAVPGPVYFDDQHLIDLLHAIPLVGWKINADVGAKGEKPGLF